MLQQIDLKPVINIQNLNDIIFRVNKVIYKTIIPCQLIISVLSLN